MYNRLFTKILDSSIWLEPHATRIVWITLLAAMDEDGMTYFACAGNLARRAGVELAECEAALQCLMSPDRNSSDKEFEGRRIDQIEGGYFVLNAKKYKAIFNREIQREQTRLRVAKHRSVTRGKGSVTNGNDASVYGVTCNDPVTQSDAVSDAETEKTRKRRKSPFAAPPGEEFFQTLRSSPAYQGIDIDRELAKIDVWLASPKGLGRKKTAQFILNWLNKIDRTLPPERPKRLNYVP